MSMEDEVSRMSGGFFKLAVAGDNNSFRNLTDGDKPDDIHANASGSVTAGGDDAGASASMPADGVDFSQLPPPPVPVRGVARDLSRPTSSNDLRGLSAVLATITCCWHA